MATDALDRLEALAVAAQALVAGGLAAQARPIVDEIVEVVRAARGQRADVVSIATARARR